jgi:hypothetical protein
MIGHRGSVRRTAEWIGFALSLASLLYFLNLVIYHFWAAYVPPYETALHKKWAIECLIVVGASLVLLFWFVVRLWRGRSKVS